MFASSKPDDLDSQLEKLSLKLVQSYGKKARNNHHHHHHLQNHYFYNTKSNSLFSLPTPREPQKSSRQKKMVRFADSLGYELVSVRIVTNNYFTENILHSEEDEESEEITSEEDESVKSELSAADPNTFIYDNLNFTWQCLFDQPGIQPDFYARLNQKKVLLEAIYTNHFKLNGFIRVCNLSFHKRVFIRYTLNNWHTYTDSECTYVLNGTNEQTERFKFSIVLDKTGLLNTIDESLRYVTSSPALKLEFAICYEVRSTECLQVPSECSYWDNNDSTNYQYNCFFKIINPFKV